MTIDGWLTPTDALARTCLQQAPAFYLQWILFLLGMAGIALAGSVGLLLFLRTFLSRVGRAGRLPLDHEMHLFLRWSTALALVALGGGLIVAVWWAWRVTGLLHSGDPREIWMASTWLFAGMSLLSWQMARRSALWAAGLSLAAALVGLVGLLIW